MDIFNEHTNELYQSLKLKQTNLDTYLSLNCPVIETKAKDIWGRLIEESETPKGKLISDSTMSYAYFYDVVNGRKIPSRDMAIRLSLSLRAGLECCQRIMLCCGRPFLHPQIRRDAVLIYALSNDLTIEAANRLLASHGEKTL